MLQVLTYSPDGRCLAAGAHDSRIYLMDTKTFGSRAQCKGHHSFISHLDFSKDGKVLQSVSGDYELLFWDVATGKHILLKTLRAFQPGTTDALKPSTLSVQERLIP